MQLSRRAKACLDKDEEEAQRGVREDEEEARRDGQVPLPLAAQERKAAVGFEHAQSKDHAAHSEEKPVDSGPHVLFPRPVAPHSQPEALDASRARASSGADSEELAGKELAGGGRGDGRVSVSQVWCACRTRT